MMEPRTNAFVAIKTPDGRWQVRNALFVYVTSAGAAWVEPTYLEQFAVGEAMHHVVGKITAKSDGFVVATSGGGSATFGPMQEDMPGWADWETAQRDLAAQGTTVEDERERLRAIVDASYDEGAET